MIKKIAVQIKKDAKTSYTFQRLVYCKYCGSFSSFNSNYCEVCNKNNTNIAIQDIAKILHGRKQQLEIILLLSLFSLSIIFARNLLEILVTFLAGALLLFLLLTINKKYYLSLSSRFLKSLLAKKTPQILNGLGGNLESAVKSMNELDYKNGYEKLRNIGHFLINEPIKNYKIICLNTFILRQDMPLELDTVVPKDYSDEFISYLSEVVKVNKQVIRRKTFDYVMRNRNPISGLENGTLLLTAIAGAMLRMKSYVHAYQHFIGDFLEYLPKERFLKLCKILSASSINEWPELHKKAEETIKLKYNFDSDFQGLL